MRILVILYLINQPIVIEDSVLLKEKRLQISPFSEYLGITAKHNYQGYTHGT